jgi:hypothetical protein
MPTDHPSHDPELRATVRLPAEVDQADRVLGPLTARQTLRLAGGALVLWLAFTFLHTLLPVPVLLVVSALAGGAWAALVLGWREGLPLTAWLGAALRHHRGPHLHTAYGHTATPAALHPHLAAQHTPAAPLMLPGATIANSGTVDLGRDGVAALAQCATVNFALRTAVEQHGLAAGFGRWLNSLTGPAHILVRAAPLDLADRADHLLHAAPALPHPALEQAAREHADFLADLSSCYDLLQRRVYLTVREAGPGPGAALRAVQRREEAVRALAACEVTATALDGWATQDALAAACTPPPPPPREQLIPATAEEVS